MNEPRKLTVAEVRERARVRRSQLSSTIEVEPTVSPTEIGVIEVTEHQDADAKRKRLANAKYKQVVKAHEESGRMQRLSRSQRRRRRRARKAQKSD